MDKSGHPVGWTELWTAVEWTSIGFTANYVGNPQERMKKNTISNCLLLMALGRCRRTRRSALGTAFARRCAFAALAARPRAASHRNSRVYRNTTLWH